MNFISTIDAAIKSAMLSKDKERLAPLRDIKSKLLLENTSGNGEVSEETALKICMKLHKQRIETYELYMSQNRNDLAEEELFQSKVIEEFLPRMLTYDEVKIEVLSAIQKTGVNSLQEIGKVMGMLSSKLAGKADGKLIAQLVKDELSKPL
jgi:uncharacterized protein